MTMEGGDPGRLRGWRRNPGGWSGNSRSGG